MISTFVPLDAGRGQDWSRTAVTRDGVAYRIRPIRPDDAARELEFIRTLSDESRYRRLMHAVHEPSPELIDRFVNVDYSRSMAFVAVTGAGERERIIGVARYASDDSSGACEFAVAVADAWQSRGIGTMLTRLLFDYAKAAGLKRAYGTILADNARMIGLAHWLGMETHVAPDDAKLMVASRRLN